MDSDIFYLKYKKLIHFHEHRMAKIGNIWQWQEFTIIRVQDKNYSMRVNILDTNNVSKGI